MVEFVKEGFLTIISLGVFFVIFLIIIGQSERRRKGESFFIKKDNSKKEDPEGCFTTILNGIGSIVVLALMIFCLLVMVWVILKALAFPQ